MVKVAGLSIQAHAKGQTLGPCILAGHSPSDVCQSSRAYPQKIMRLLILERPTGSEGWWAGCESGATPARRNAYFLEACIPPRTTHSSQGAGTRPISRKRMTIRLAPDLESQVRSSESENASSGGFSFVSSTAKDQSLGKPGETSRKVSRALFWSDHRLA